MKAKTYLLRSQSTVFVWHSQGSCKQKKFNLSSSFQVKEQPALPQIKANQAHRLDGIVVIFKML